MSVLAATTIAALLIASPSANDADRVAANGGFLLGNAQRCGIAADRVERAGQLVRELIRASAEDDRAEEDAATRFARFFLASAMEPAGLSLSAADAAEPSCRKISGELERLERHGLLGGGANPARGGTANMRFRLGDGE